MVRAEKDADSANQTTRERESHDSGTFLMGGTISQHKALAKRKELKVSSATVYRIQISLVTICSL